MNSKITSFSITNGLTVVHIERSDSLNVSINLMVIAGSAYESPEEVGVAHFLEHIVSDGTEKYPTKKDIAGLIDERGGMRNALTNKETVEYFVKVLKEDSEVAFEYLSEVVIHPLIREEDITKQKKIIEQEICRFKSNPEQFAPRLIYSVLFPGTRIGGLNTGDVEDVKRISRKDILSYHQKTHCAKNMVLTVCGNIEEDQVKILVEKYFGNMKSGEKVPSLRTSVIPTSEPLILTVADSKQAVLSVGYQGYKWTDSSRYVTDLLAMILTRGASSRLFYEIRERRALAYIVNGNNFSGRNIGAFTLQIGLANEKVEECLQIIKTELNKIISDGVSESELKKALAYIKSNIAFSFESSLYEATYYSRLWCSTGVIRSINEELKQYELVVSNPSLVQEVVKKMLSIDPAVLIIRPGNVEL